MSKQKWNIIRIGVGDYARGKKELLYKEIIDCAKQNKVITASVFSSFDGFHIKSKPEVVRLFGGVEKSQALIIEVLIQFEHTDGFLEELRNICISSDNPVAFSVLDSNVEVYGV